MLSSKGNGCGHSWRLHDNCMNELFMMRKSLKISMVMLLRSLDITPYMTVSRYNKIEDGLAIPTPYEREVILLCVNEARNKKSLPPITGEELGL